MPRSDLAQGSIAVKDRQVLVRQVAGALECQRPAAIVVCVFHIPVGKAHPGQKIISVAPCSIPAKDIGREDRPEVTCSGKSRFSGFNVFIRKAALPQQVVIDAGGTIQCPGSHNMIQDAIYGGIIMKKRPKSRRNGR